MKSGVESGVKSGVKSSVKSEEARGRVEHGSCTLLADKSPAFVSRRLQREKARCEERRLANKLGCYFTRWLETQTKELLHTPSGRNLPRDGDRCGCVPRLKRDLRAA